MDLASRDLRVRVTKTVLALIVGSLIASSTILAVIFSSGFAIVAVSGSSMLPLIHDRDTIIIQKADSLQRDQIAILRKPAAWLRESEHQSSLVKRVIAIPGDTLKFDGHSFLVNGVSVYSLDTIEYECALGAVGYEHTLSSQEVFVMGDNPKSSLDSRRVFCDGKTEDSLVPYENLTDYGKITMKF